MIKKCLVCGKEFVTYPSKVKIGRGKYCSKKCCLQRTAIKKGQRLSPETEFKKGQMPWSFQGWRYTISRKTGRKYKQIYSPSHPNCDSRKYVREHRLVAEMILGRLLNKSEIVHHKDGNTLNNSPLNLEVLDKKEHDRRNVIYNIHRRWVKRGGGFYSRTKSRNNLESSS